MLFLNVSLKIATAKPKKTANNNCHSPKDLKHVTKAFTSRYQFSEICQSRTIKETRKTIFTRFSNSQFEKLIYWTFRRPRKSHLHDYILWGDIFCVKPQTRIPRVSKRSTEEGTIGRTMNNKVRHVETLRIQVKQRRNT